MLTKVSWRKKGRARERYDRVSQLPFLAYNPEIVGVIRLVLASSIGRWRVKIAIEAKPVRERGGRPRNV